MVESIYCFDAELVWPRVMLEKCSSWMGVPVVPKGRSNHPHPTLDLPTPQHKLAQNPEGDCVQYKSHVSNRSLL